MTQPLTTARLAVLISASLTLAACSHAPAPVDVRIQERTVEVMRPCPVEVPTRPAPIDGATLPEDARDALRIVTAKLLEWAGQGGYGDRAEAALAVCQGAISRRPSNTVPAVRQRRASLG